MAAGEVLKDFKCSCQVSLRRIWGPFWHNTPVAMGRGDRRRGVVGAGETLQRAAGVTQVAEQGCGQATADGATPEC